MRGRSMNGQGFCGRGNGQGLGMGNRLPYCRNNPMIPSRRFMAAAANANTGYYPVDESEYLKNAASYLKTQLDIVNKRLQVLKPEA